MRLCVRLVALTAFLVAVAMALVHLRTETTQAGNRLHSLYSQKRSLEKACSRLELGVARLKSQERLREQAADLRQEETVGPNGRPETVSHDFPPGRQPFLMERKSTARP